MSIGGTLTHFAAPPVLMVARPWGWDTRVHAVALRLARRRRDCGLDADVLRAVPAEFAALAARPPVPDIDNPRRGRDRVAALLPVPRVAHVPTHVFFMAWTVFNAHYPALFLGGFLFFLGFARATAAYQSHGSS